MERVPADAPMTFSVLIPARYASTRLMEVESRARFIESIHGDVDITG